MAGCKDDRRDAHVLGDSLRTDRHCFRRLDVENAEALRILRQTPVAVAAGTSEAATAHITAVAARLKLVNQQIKQAERKLDELCDAFDEPDSGDAAEQPLARQAAAGQPSGRRDATILRSAPGLGRGILAILLAEATTLLRERTYQALRSLCGTAPVTKRSGKRCIVVMRQACHVRLRAALYHWARVAIQHDARSRSRYAELRKRGHSHARALRTVADRLLAVACAMLKSQTAFEPQSPSLQAAA